MSNNRTQHLNQRWKRKEGLSWQDFNAGTIVLNPNIQKIHQLNPTATLIWNLLEQNPTLQDMAQRLQAEYDLEFEQGLVDCHEFIKNAQTWELIERI